MEFLLVSLLNGLSYGLLLFMLGAGLTLIFSLMGVLNFAHASFYMLGAYLGYALAGRWGFVPALLLAPLLVGALGAAFERLALRRVHAHGHVHELLMTFGLSYVLLELVQLIWGRGPVAFRPPPWLEGAAFTLLSDPPHGLRLLWGDAPAGLCDAATGGAVAGDALAGRGQRIACTPFPATRAFMALVALAMLGGLWLLLARTRTGLVVQAALTHPGMVQALGHNVPRVFMLVFGAGSALAALAGVLGGSTFVTEPAMALALGPVIFVVAVVGGLGSLGGAFAASLLIGLVQTLAVSVNLSLADALPGLGLPAVTLAQLAPLLPYALLLLMLLLRPRGLMGRREA